MGRTAVAVARIRAMETLRDDQLFDDPLAAAFAAADTPAGGAPAGSAAAAGRRAALRTPSPSALAFHVVVRTRFYDDALLAASAAGCGQVVLLGAGLDARAHRLAWPSPVRLFELDTAAVLAVKDAVLSGQGATPRCRRLPVPVDLREDWSGPLLAAGLDPGRPTAWLAEGLLVYLRPGDAERLLRTVTSLSAHGSRLATERSDAVHAVGSSWRPHGRPSDVTRLWQGGLSGELPGWLDGHGWRSRTHSLADVAAGYGRPAPAGARSGFVTAVRRSR